MSRRAAFAFHLATGTLTGLLLLFPVVGALLSPIDIFARPGSLLVGHLQYLLAAIVYYGFSSVALHLVPLPAGWSAFYTAASWLFFLWAFYPVVSGPGMMRRIAGTMEDYLAAERLRENLRLGAVCVFAGTQIAYLLFVARRIRGVRPSPA